jgi:hypothetical protein
MIVNDTVTITIEQEDDFPISFVLPAFTQSSLKVEDTVDRHLVEYLDNSTEQGEPTSVGDFILWLIRVASETEPLESNYREKEITVEECECQFCRLQRAIAFAKGLMKGEAATFKAGYSLENSAIAAAEYHGVDREVIRQHLESST